MIDIYVCMGSACYLRGAEDIVKILKRKITENKLEANLHLKGSFCLGPCNQGVVVKVENRFFKNLNPQNANEKFEEEIFPYIMSLEGELDG